MGEKKLARASVSQRAVPLTHAKQRSFALETISASKKRTTPPEGGVGKFMERATRIELASDAWEAPVITIIRRPHWLKIILLLLDNLTPITK